MEQEEAVDDAGPRRGKPDVSQPRVTNGLPEIGGVVTDAIRLSAPP